jgi:hypothetical protein
LRLFVDDQERLRTLAESPNGQAVDCAVPTREPLDARLPAPEPPSRATILAADGSQVYPDPHGMALFYVINIGSLVYRHGSGQAPEAASKPTVAHAIDKAGNPLTPERLNARRDVAELRQLADLAESEAGEAPLLALLDSTLSLQAWSTAIPKDEQERLQEAYFAQLGRLRQASAGLVGVISRSRRAGVVKLLDMARMDDPSNPPGELGPFLGLTDQALWGNLRPGERSALFLQGGTPPVYCFYLNTDPPDWLLPGREAEPARIELPEWVALSPGKLDVVHALLYDQCRINNGYPYALSRADELAIILREEHEALELMILQAADRQGLPLPRLSHKAAQKRVTRSPARRRL